MPDQCGGGYERGYQFDMEARPALPGQDEQFIWGLASRRAVLIYVRMSDGGLLTVRPVRAPASALAAHPQFRGYRFFTAFFSFRIDAVRAEAQDSSGHTIERARSELGIFIPVRRGMGPPQP